MDLSLTVRTHDRFGSRGNHNGSWLYLSGGGQIESRRGMVKRWVGWSPDWGQWVVDLRPSRGDDDNGLYAQKHAGVVSICSDQPVWWWVLSVPASSGYLDDNLWYKNPSQRKEICIYIPFCYFLKKKMLPREFWHVYRTFFFIENHPRWNVSSFHDDFSFEDSLNWWFWSLETLIFYDHLLSCATSLRPINTLDTNPTTSNSILLIVPQMSFTLWRSRGDTVWCP